MQIFHRAFPKLYLLSVIFMVGFAALIYEVYSVQVLFMFFVNNTQAVSIAISSFLAGLAVSSLVFSWYVRDTARNLRIVFWMQLAAAAYGYFVLRRVDLVPTLLDLIHAHIGNLTLIEIFKVGLVWLFLFVPAFFIGGALPLINGLYGAHRDMQTRDTGVVYFWDMAGAILGALLTGFYFIPQLGIAWTVMIPVIINLFVCVLCAATWRYFAMVGLLIACMVITTTAMQRSDIAVAASPLERQFLNVVFDKQSPFGRIRVDEAPNGERRLYINYRTMCSSSSGNVSEGKLGYYLSHLKRNPEDLAPRALNIGLGCGTTAAALAFTLAFKELDIVEINPVVKEAAEGYFHKANRDVVKQPHVHTIIANGAEYIRTTDKVYDAIAIDIEEVNVIYSSPLFTKEYYELLKQRLAPGGVLGVWSFTVSDDFSKVMYNTMAAVFKHVVVQPVAGSMLYFASDEPLDALPKLIRPRDFEIRENILKNPNKGINTLNYKLLEKYYNANHEFGLPDDYTEKFFSPKP